jgi:flagellar hook-basal body complex protein FliE
MKIESSLAGLGYARALQATQPAEGAGRGALETFGAIAGDFHASLRATESTVVAGVIGKADPQSVVQALAQAELALQTAVAVRDKVVEAYQEILRMPV